MIVFFYTIFLLQLYIGYLAEQPLDGELFLKRHYGFLQEELDDLTVHGDNIEKKNQ